MPEIILTTGAPAPIGPYSQAVKAGGLVFVSGQIAIDPAAGTIAREDIEGQTEQVFLNLKAILEAAGSGLEKAVKATLYLRNLEDFGRVNEIYARYLGSARPARSTIEAARLPKEALVEIDLVAVA